MVLLLVLVVLLVLLVTVLVAVVDRVLAMALQVVAAAAVVVVGGITGGRVDGKRKARERALRLQVGPLAGTGRPLRLLSSQRPVPMAYLLRASSWAALEARGPVVGLQGRGGLEPRRGADRLPGGGGVKRNLATCL